MVALAEARPIAGSDGADTAGAVAPRKPKPTDTPDNVVQHERATVPRPNRGLKSQTVGEVVWLQQARAERLASRHNRYAPSIYWYNLKIPSGMVQCPRLGCRDYSPAYFVSEITTPYGRTTRLCVDCRELAWLEYQERFAWFCANHKFSDHRQRWRKWVANGNATLSLLLETWQHAMHYIGYDDATAFEPETSEPESTPAQTAEHVLAHGGAQWLAEDAKWAQWNNERANLEEELSPAHEDEYRERIWELSGEYVTGLTMPELRQLLMQVEEYLAAWREC